MRFSGLFVTGLVLFAPRLVDGQERGLESDDEIIGPAKCTLQLIEPYMVNATQPHESWRVCDMDPEYEDGVEFISYELEGLPDGFYDDVDYGETSVFISKARRKGAAGDGFGRDKQRTPHAGGKLTIEKGAKVRKEKVENKGRGKGNGGGRTLRGNGVKAGHNDDRRRRALAQLAGNSTLLILYAVPLDHTNNARTRDQLGNELFGLCSSGEAGCTPDSVNARSQAMACSRNQLVYSPACGAGSSCENDPDFVNGVLLVPIDYNISGVASGTVKNWVSAAANAILSPKNLAQSDFTQIMNVIPDEADWGGAAAWAYLPGSVSAFRDSYSYRMGVQIHEFGHNLGLHHSGYGSASYADHSCLMGNPSYGDDGPQICWNGAKSWETGWYDSDSMEVDVKAGLEFDGHLVGVADWANEDYTAGTHKVVIKIPDSSQTLDYYVMFNRKKGPNGGVKFAVDQVTVTRGKYKKISWHDAALSESSNPHNPEEFRVANFDNSGRDLVVKVCGIDMTTTTGSPDTARVQIFLDGPESGLSCPGEFCTSASECDDSNVCTEDTCSADGKCQSEPIAGCGFYLACGSSDGECAGQQLLAAADELHEVRCCSDTALTGWHQDPDCPYPVWSKSALVGGCYHAENHASAASICSSEGGRLCTADELLSDCTRGSGCSHDQDMIWSSTTVPGSPSDSPSGVPTGSPLVSPSDSPRKVPSASPSRSPSTNPTAAFTGSPSSAPSTDPTISPTGTPSVSPSDSPSKLPSVSPSRTPSTNPTAAFTGSPSSSPSTDPTISPTGTPSVSPSDSPSKLPSVSPSRTPSTNPTAAFTGSPSDSPSVVPTKSASPSNAAPGAYFLACGASHKSCRGKKEPAQADELHEVRCCSSTSISGWSKRCPYNVWGASTLGEEGDGCYHGETHSSALSICANAGGRLCTARELLDDCTRGSGCSHDNDMIWSSDPVVPTAAPTNNPTERPTSASPTGSMRPTMIGALGETGRVEVSHEGETVRTRYTYANPVVVAFVNTRNEGDSADVRVTDVTKNSFKVFLEETPGSDINHIHEQVSYFVMEEGRHELDGGLAVEAGLRLKCSKVHRKPNGFTGDTVVFDTPFTNTPAILTTLNTYNNRAFMSSLATSVTTSSFKISQEALETGSLSVEEDIAWMAFSTGSGTTSGGSPYISQYDDTDGVSNGVNQAPYSINIGGLNFTGLPDLVVGLYETGGTDGAYARGAGTFSATAQTVYAEEDTTVDSERNHVSVPVAWVGFRHNSDLFSAGPVAATLGCKEAEEDCGSSEECCSGLCHGDGMCVNAAADA